MPKRLTALSVFITLSLLIGACGREAEKANIEFMEYGQDYRGKPMFARLEHKLPIADTREHREQLARVTPAYLAGLDQEQVDQIYARLTAGPIPDGPYDGSLFFPQGSSGKLRASEIVGGLKGLAVRVKGKKLEILGKILWKGKVFYRDEMVLRNRIEDLAVLAPIVDDVLNVPKIEVDSRDSWLMFPARLYCGQSLLDGRRESLIIDYAFTDEINGYREKPDFLAGRRGFMVRDEIRMIRPGFYLGRAYLNRVFVLNFTLYNSEIAEATRDQWIETGQVPEDCWIGHQRLAGAAAN
ncbi:MAG: hypothetical protein KDI63_11850 [Gammaproteobacteria bacterium]|nr:hypothetical protein [Gammaproteobacteria bacterium]